MPPKGPKSTSRNHNRSYWKNHNHHRHKNHQKIKSNTPNEPKSPQSIISIESSQYCPSIVSAIDSIYSRQSWKGHPRRSKRTKKIYSKKQASITSKIKQNEESDTEYTVKKIHAVKWNPKIAKYQYKAEWEGYTQEHNSFTEHIDNCIEKVADFWCDQYLNKVMESEENRIITMRHLDIMYDYDIRNDDKDITNQSTVFDVLREKCFKVINKAPIVSPTQKSVWMSRYKTPSPWLKPKSVRRDITDKQEADDSDVPSPLPMIIAKRKERAIRKGRVKRINKINANITK